MSSGYTTINARCDDEDENDADRMFCNESSLYDHKSGGEGMFSDDGDAGTPHLYHMSTTRATQSNVLPKSTSSTTAGTVTGVGENRNSVVSVHPATKPTTPVTKPTAPVTKPSAPAARSEPRSPPVITTPSVPFSPSPSTLGSVRQWTQNKLKYTKQYMSERLGVQSFRTVDSQTDAKVQALRDTQAQYAQILRLAKTMVIHFQRVVQTQRVLGDAFGDLSRFSGAELCDQFTCNAETQRVLCRNGDLLIASLNVFVTSMTTLCNTTIEDTLVTVKKCEVIRLKFDANREHLEALRRQRQDHATGLKIQESEKVVERQHLAYERVHNDLIVKLKFLDENKITVCQKHLYLLHKAFMNYVSGNRQGVDDVLQQFTASVRSTSTNQNSVQQTSSSLTSSPSPPLLNSPSSVASSSNHSS